MTDMPKPRPLHLHREKTRHGNFAWYVRVNRGPRIRIKAEYGTPEFQEAYLAALAGERPKPISPASKGTLEWLWVLYRQSSAWLDLSVATRGQRENIMRSVLKTSGNEPLSLITRKAVVKGRDRRAATPSQAKNFLSTMRGLFQWALDAELVGSDPTAGVKRPKPKRSEGFPAWTDDDITKFERRWPVGTRQRVMFDLFLYTGLRRGDAARVGRQHVKDGAIVIDTEKTGVRVTIPILPALKATLDAGPTGDMAFIGNATNGNPLPKEVIGNLFREACRAAGVRKSAHGLRKAAAANAANHGATEAELEAIFGWTGGKMAALYTKSANRAALSTAAANKLARDKHRTSIPAPRNKVRAGRRKSK